MKKLVQFLLVSCVLIWSTGVFADAPRNSSNQSPESIVTCGPDKGDGLILIAVCIGTFKHWHGPVYTIRRHMCSLHHFTRESRVQIY
jgi:hypothetical protein